MTRTLEAPVSPARKPRATKSSVTLEQIQQRAYEIFVERRGAAGSEMEDWLRAERELAQAGTVERRKSPRSPKSKAA